MSSDRDSQGPGYTGLITIWPEWTEQDLLTEKWDVQASSTAAKSAKDPKVKGASFEDPEGRTRLPHSLLQVVKDWKRPQELFGENLCIVRNINHVNLKEPNEHLIHSEFIRHYLSHVTLVWYLAQRKKLQAKHQPSLAVAPPVLPVPPPPETSPKASAGSHKESKHNIGKDATASKTSQGGEAQPKAVCFEDPMNDWAPWNLIYGGPPPAPKASVKGEPPVAHVVTNLPQYNANGKYAVKLFWMGNWRKIVVDDYIPVDERNQPLLPVCDEVNELWPLILTKAVLKVVSLDFGGGIGSSEIGAPGFILHVLTGYIPHVINLDQPKLTRKAIWNKLQTLLSLNKKPPPEDVLTAVAENFDIRCPIALRNWTAQNDPAYIQKLDSIRANRLQASPVAVLPTSSAAQAPASTLSVQSTLAPKSLVRSVSARSTGNAPRKLELAAASSNATTASLSATIDPPRIRNPKTPEVLIYASYRSEPGVNVFDPEGKSRSGNLYDNGFLRTESHPILLRGLHDKQPRIKPRRSLVPRYKLFRPLRVNLDRYSQILLRGQRKREHPIRSVDFVSLHWKEQGRLTHQTASRAFRLITQTTPEAADQVHWKPMDSYRNTLPPIPENCAYPRRRPKPSHPEAVIKPPSPPPSPVHEERPQKSKLTDPSKPQANQQVPEAVPLPPIAPPPLSTEQLQKQCRLNRGSLEFNRFYESLETIYVFTKPETFDYQAAFSFYQSNVLTDGRPPVTKKKGGEQTTQQSVSGSEAASRAAPTKPALSSPNQGKFAKVIADLPSPFMMVDNPYPTNVVIGVSAASRWFFASKPETKSQERMSVFAGTIEELKGVEKPSPVTVILKPAAWVYIKSEPALVSVKTSSVQGVCFQIPAGRHVFRLKVVCPGRRELEPHGFVIRTFSRDPVQLGTEDFILKSLVSDSYQYSILSRKTLLPILRWWKSNGSPAFSHPPHRDLIAILGLEEEACNKTTRRVLFDAMLAAVYSAMQVYLCEFCTTKGAFTLRAFIGDLSTRNVLNLNKAQLAKKDSKGSVAVPVSTAKLEAHPTSRLTDGAKKKQKQGESSVSSPTPKASTAASERDSARDKAALAKKDKPAPVRRIVDKNEIKAASYWQLYFQVAKASNILQARKSGSKKKEQLLKTAQEMLDAILRNEQLFANCFFRNLCRNLPAEWLDLNFFYQQERRFISREMTGTFQDFPVNTWKLFFRDTFTVQEPLLISFRLTTAIACMRLTIVNNDTGQAVPSTLFQPQPFLYEKNSSGYAVSAEARSSLLGWKGAPWSLRIVQALDPFKHESSQADSLLVKFPGATPLTNFVTKELCDYFLPDTSVDPNIARITVTVKSQSLVTLNFTTSNAEARFELQISNKGCCVCRGFGHGIIVVPSFLFKSTDPLQPETFSIKVTCLDDSWPLSGPEWKFAYIEKSKRLAVEYGRETPSTPPSTSPVKGEKAPVKKTTKATRDREKDDKSDKESVDSARSKNKDSKEKTTFDAMKPHWVAKFVIDAGDTEFQCTRDLSFDEAYRQELLHVLAADPTILQRGREFREDYIRKHKDKFQFASPESAEFPGWIAGTARATWPSPSGKFFVPFDLASFHRPAAGDAPEEVDLFVHQNKLRALSAAYNEAFVAKEAHVRAERDYGNRQIHQQNELIRSLLECAVSARKEYIEQRDAKKKQLDEWALEEQKSMAPVVVAEHHPKTEDKHKKGKN